MDEYIKLLEEALTELIEIHKVSDRSVADYVLQLETAAQFIYKALKTEDRLDVFKALQKAYDVLKKEDYDDQPENEDYNDLVDRLEKALERLQQEEVIMKNNEMKKIITESVIGFLNGDKPRHKKTSINEASVEDFDIPEEDKKKIEEVVRKTLNRKGLLSFVYGTNVEDGKTSVGARIDPTANGDWILAKEELLYEMPIKYNYKLHDFVRKLREQIENK